MPRVPWLADEFRPEVPFQASTRSLLASRRVSLLDADRCKNHSEEDGHFRATFLKVPVNSE